MIMQHTLSISFDRENGYRDNLRVRLAMLLIDRARSMYICVQLYVRYYKYMNIITGERENRMLFRQKIWQESKKTVVKDHWARKTYNFCTCTS